MQVALREGEAPEFKSMHNVHQALSHTAGAIRKCKQCAAIQSWLFVWAIQSPEAESYVFRTASSRAGSNNATLHYRWYQNWSQTAKVYKHIWQGLHYPPAEVHHKALLCSTNQNNFPGLVGLSLDIRDKNFYSTSCALGHAQALLWLEAYQRSDLQALLLVTFQDCHFHTVTSTQTCCWSEGGCICQHTAASSWLG